MNSYLSGVPGTPDIDDEFIEQQKAQEELEKQQLETQQTEATASPEQTKTEDSIQQQLPDPKVAAETEQREDQEENRKHRTFLNLLHQVKLQ